MTEPVAPPVTASNGTGGVQLSWKPVMVNVDGTPITGQVVYNLWRGPSPTKLVETHTGLTGTSFLVTANLPPGGEVYFALTAQELSPESPKSNVVSVAIPK